MIGLAFLRKSFVLKIVISVMTSVNLPENYDLNDYPQKLLNKVMMLSTDSKKLLDTSEEGKIRKDVLYKTALPNLLRNYEQSGKLIWQSLTDFNYSFRTEKINTLFQLYQLSFV